MKSLKELRHEANLTQQQCAELFNTSTRTWQRYEASRTEVPATIYFKLQEIVEKKN